MKNLIIAQKKFNRMYERVSSLKNISIEEYKAVRNYGRNMIKLYNIKDDIYNEFAGKVKAITNMINQRS